MLWEMAGEKDYPPAQLDLAERYETGKGVRQDLVKAYFWYRMAWGNSAISKHFIEQFEDQLSTEEVLSFIDLSHARRQRNEFPPP